MFIVYRLHFSLFGLSKIEGGGWNGVTPQEYFVNFIWWLLSSLTCNPEKDVKAWLLGKEKWGYDYTYDCTGNVNVMRCALEVAHRYSTM